MLFEAIWQKPSKRETDYRSKDEILPPPSIWLSTVPAIVGPFKICFCSVMKWKNWIRQNVLQGECCICTEMPRQTCMCWNLRNWEGLNESRMFYTKQGDGSCVSFWKGKNRERKKKTKWRGGKRIGNPTMWHRAEITILHAELQENVMAASRLVSRK